MAISTAVDLTRISRIVGYKVKSGIFSPTTPYLPQRIAVFAEANTANQATLDTDPYEFISAKEAAGKYGYGSPMHQIARILRPLSGNPLGGIPTIAYPVEEAAGATAALYTLGIAVATTVTENATHKIYINGRDNIDGVSYDFTVIKGQSAADVQDSIVDAINSVVASPVVAAEVTTNVAVTTKWKGETSKISLEIDTQGKDAGIVYSEVSNVVGTGSPTVSTVLAKIGNKWDTVALNGLGKNHLEAFEIFNGTPDPDAPSGRYSSTIFKPLVALFGGVDSDKDDVVLITNANARKDQVTNVYCPAPNSKGMEFEAAANMCMTYAPIAQNSPHNDNSGKSYPDMPIPSNEVIGDFSDYNARDFMAKKGASTVNIVNGKYTVQDFVTTYAPDGDSLPKFRFVRDLNIDWNYAFNWLIIMARDVQDKAIIQDNSPTRVSNVISPKQGKQLLVSHIEEMEKLALITDSAFSIESIQVGINLSNPARLDFFNRYKRSSVAHIVSADTEVDFNFNS